MKSIILHPLYFPPIAYFAAIASASSIYIDYEALYQKQSYKNRCYILSSQKVDTLTIPIVGGNNRKPISQTEIDYSSSWQRLHWRSIQSCYGKAAFYEHYSHAIRQLIMEKNNTLLALNQKILTYCLEILGIEKEITNLADANEDEFRNAKDLRKAIHPKVNHENLDFYNSVPYFQNFGSKFAPNLSIIDLLMCEGPQARLVIQNSHK